MIENEGRIVKAISDELGLLHTKEHSCLNCKRARILLASIQGMRAGRTARQLLISSALNDLNRCLSARLCKSAENG